MFGFPPALETATAVDLQYKGEALGSIILCIDRVRAQKVGIGV